MATTMPTYAEILSRVENASSGSMVRKSSWPVSSV
jgi:hypothetical protein